MRITYDAAKNARNLALRKLSFECVSQFDFANASYDVDTRREYGEVRYIAVGDLDQRLHVLCFAETAEGIRVISFRKANQREVKKYAKPKATE